MTSPQAKKLAEELKKIADSNKALQTAMQDALRQVDKADGSLSVLQQETKG